MGIGRVKGHGHREPRAAEMNSGASVRPRTDVARPTPWLALGAWPRRLQLLSQIAAFARPWPATAIALPVYLVPAALAPGRPRSSQFAYFNYLADASSQEQLRLRLQPPRLLDLVPHEGKRFLSWPPFPLSRYVFGLLVPLLVLTALGIQRWHVDVPWLVMIVDVTTFTIGATLKLLLRYS